MDSTRKFDTDSVARRDEIVFGKRIDWQTRNFGPGVCERFEGLTAAAVRELIDLGFMRLEARMNSSPSIRQFLEFSEPMSTLGIEFRFEGFTFDPANGFAEVVLEGISYEGPYTAETGLAFVKFFIPFRPDEMSIEKTTLRAWWD